MKIILASKNQDKIKEIQKILTNTNVELKTFHDINIPELFFKNFNFIFFILFILKFNLNLFWYHTC